ncbi:hypothetical protein AX15_000387 [Amanita polypyramis BW_CC]|nr:hypothetical protein AX15_000387 [Amanita polypyramis BW_CC]
MRELWRRLFLSLVVSGTAFARVYDQIDSISGHDFLDAFEVQVIPDPAHGRVNNVDAQTASRENLTFASDDHFIMRADYTKYLDPRGPGRDSVRLISYKQYTTSVMIFNIRHMPAGCGTWPAIRTKGTDTSQGKIDILEGINDVGPNQVTLLTDAGCTMPPSRPQLGTPVNNDCDVNASSASGCGVKLFDPLSYGPALNDNGGGWYAIERNSDFIKVWFWSRNAWTPQDVRDGENSVDTDNWGIPAAYFPGDSCPISQKFGPHNIMFGLTFCGDWAGNAYNQSGCPSTCVDFVNYSPSEFRNAYFDFEWLKIYA